MFSYAIVKDNSSQISSFIFNAAWLSPSYCYDFIFNLLSKDNIFNNHTLPNKNLLTIALLGVIYPVFGLLFTIPIDFISQLLKKEIRISNILFFPIGIGVAFLTPAIFVYLLFSFIGSLI